LSDTGHPKYLAQGSQFTSLAFTSPLKAAGDTISTDGRGRYLNNIFIERLWRSLKYEAVYLYEMDNVHAAQSVIGDWIKIYSHKRPPSTLDGNTPDMAYETKDKQKLATQINPEQTLNKP